MKYILTLALLAGCTCSNATHRAKVKSMCDGYGGLHALHFSRQDAIECNDGTKFDVDEIKKG